MNPSKPSERELQALKILWELGGGTVRDVCGELERRGEQLAYTTVLSLLQVMEQKGLVGHTAEGKVYSYHAKVERDSTFRSLARDFLHNVFDGAVEQFVLHALQDQRLTVDEIGQLEAMIARAKAGTKTPSTAKQADPPAKRAAKSTAKRRTPRDES
ncbi:MAG: BlaI/MecI/CopY family transcriptional regulator [Pirellulales bacterium]